jgi:hypothetical protein
MARPRSKEPYRRHSIRFVDEDWAKVKELADQAAKSPSEFIRTCALQKRIHSKVNLKAIAELKQLGGLQKLCLMEVRKLPADHGAIQKLNQTLDAVLKAIPKLDSAE